MSQGVDISGHQSVINLATMRAGGIDWLYAKASEGVGYVDPLCTSHWNNARAAGMAAGLYHYARPDTNSPEQDAAHFAAQLLSRGAAQAGALPPCLDMEENAAVNMVSWTQRCITRLRELTGYSPIMIYANTSWWSNQLANGTWLDDQTWAWVAHYGRAPGNPGFRNERVVMHQWASDARIVGYDGPIDINECWVDLSVLTQGSTPGPIIDPDPRPDGWWTVDSGQTLSSIGALVGIAWQDLAEWNALADPDVIHVGQRLRLTPPEVASNTYTVQPGDTLSGIAGILGTSWQALYELNRGLIADPNAIQVGWVLAVPGDAAPAGGDEWYEVQPGDTLSSIAAEHGIRGGYHAIFAANRDVIDNADVIKAGWRIRLPR